MQKILTRNLNETRELAKLLAGEIRGGEIVCLSGDLGAGKTAFAQGLMEGLGVEGPYTSPTFAIMKAYNLNPNTYNLETIYHIDVYRIEEKDLLDLGWKDFAGKKDTVTIVEWAEKIKNIIPKEAIWMEFKWLGENEREITVSIKNI